MTASPKIYGLIGYPVKHSLSPAMHNAAFAHHKINAEYRLFEVLPEKLEDFLLQDIEVRDINGNPAATSQISGFNVTVPYKIKAKEILEKEFPFDNNADTMQRGLYYVKLSGAINTVKREGNKLTYWNTDAEGFLESLARDLKFNTLDKNVLVIGCGGAGRAIISALSWKQEKIKKIYISDIDAQAINSAKEHFSKLPQFPDLKEKIEFILSKDIARVIKNCNLLVNATPVGMKGDKASLVDKSLFHKGLCVYDVVYNIETQLIKDARAFGLPAVGGLGMLLYQGARAFELWIGQKAPVEVMRRALEEALNK